MKKSILNLALVAALGFAPVAAMAQEASEDSSGFNWNIAVTSDYLFRGVSQTNQEAALQGGLGYEFENGIYVGTWASNVDFGLNGANTEADFFVGWNHDLSDAWNMDVSLVHYSYHGESPAPLGFDFDYSELIGKFTLNDQWTFTGAYTNDWNNSGFDSYYVNAGASFDIGNEFTLDAGVGFTRVDFPFSGTPNNFIDYSVGVSRSFGPLNATLQYVDTNNNATDFYGELAADKFVLTLGFEG
jgi:uncharacterized protein (TIGR02001 family)